MSHVIRCKVCGKEMTIDEIIKEWDTTKRNLWVEHINETGHEDWELIDKEGGNQK